MSHILQLIPVVMSHKFFWTRAMGLTLAIALDCGLDMRQWHVPNAWGKHTSSLNGFSAILVTKHVFQRTTS